MTLANIFSKGAQSPEPSTGENQESTEDKSLTTETTNQSFTPSLVITPQVSLGLDIWNTPDDKESSYVGLQEKLGVRTQWNFGGKINPYAGVGVVLGQASKNLKDPSDVVDNHSAVINRLGIEAEFGVTATLIDNDSSQISVPFGIYTEFGKATGLAPFNTAVSDFSDLQSYAGGGFRAGVDLMFKGETSDTKVGLYGQFGAREVGFHTPGYAPGEDAMVWGSIGGFGLSLSVTPHRLREEVVAPTSLSDSSSDGEEANLKVEEAVPPEGEHSAASSSSSSSSSSTNGTTAGSPVLGGTPVDTVAPVPPPSSTPDDKKTRDVQGVGVSLAPPLTLATLPIPATPSVPVDTLPAEPLTELTFQQGKIYTKTVDAQGITADQLKKAVYAVGRYNKSALSLKNCQQIGTTKVQYGSSVVTVPVVHMAIDFKVYKAQWVIAMLPARRSGDNIEIRWALIPHTENADKTVFTGPYASKLNEYKGYHYLSYDVGGWKLENGQLTYWVSSDPTGLPGWVSSIANNSGLSKNLEEMIKLSKSI